MRLSNYRFVVVLGMLAVLLISESALAESKVKPGWQECSAGDRDSKTRSFGVFSNSVLRTCVSELLCQLVEVRKDGVITSSRTKWVLQSEKCTDEQE